MPYNYPVKFGKYLLTKRIAVGGMAELFLAKMVGIKGFEKTLALKKILPEFGEDEEFVELFVDEAKMTVQLQHQNIVQVFDFGEIDQSYYIAMEFVDGPNLKNLLKRCLKKKGYFPIEMTVYIIIQVLKALEYAQRAPIGDGKTMNLVHRDVSPQNLLVSREGEIKITDFGIAKAAIKLSQTQPGKIQGKFSYMSPEQATGTEIDHRSDIFSLGIIFFEMLTGFKLYAGDDTSTKYARVREAKIPPPSNYNKNIPRELETIVMKMLAKKPDDRYQTAAEIIKILTDYLYPSSTEAIAQSLASLIKELFPIPLSQEEEIKIGKILEVDKERSTQTDFKLLKKIETPKQLEEPLLVDKKKVITRVSINANKATLKKRALVKSLLFLFILGALIVFTVRTCYKPEKKEPLATPAPQVTAAPYIESKMTPTPTPSATPVPTEKPVKPKVVVPKATPTPCPVDMAFVPEGPFNYGSPKDDPDRQDLMEIQETSFDMGPFCMDIYEYPNRIGMIPKIYITYSEAQSLCEKEGKRLCTEMEWEKACKGPKDLKYPYGPFFARGICNTEDENDNPNPPKPIGSFEGCKSGYGTYDQSGNVSEWTDSGYDSAADRGGSGKSPAWGARCSSRIPIEGKNRNMKTPYMGLRCCKNPRIGE